MTEVQNTEPEAEQLPELTTQQLLDEVSKGHRALKVYEKGVQILQGLVVLEQNIKEKTEQNRVLQAAQNEWNDKKKKALAESDDAYKRAAATTDGAQAEAKRIAEEARGTAQKITTEARMQANRILNDAKAEADTHLQKSLVLQAENSDTQAKLTTATAQLTSITQAIAAQKEAIKKFVG